MVMLDQSQIQITLLLTVEHGFRILPVGSPTNIPLPLVGEDKCRSLMIFLPFCHFDPCENRGRNLTILMVY